MMLSLQQPNPILAGKIANIMEIPPTILHLYIENFPSEICYPAPLIEQWIEITKPDVDSNSSSGHMHYFLVFKFLYQ